MNLSRPMILIFAIAWLVACGSPEERATQHVVKAKEWLEQGDAVKAKLEARNAVQIQPKNIDARLLLASIAEQARDIRAAAGHLLIVLEEDPNNLEARIKLGGYYTFGGAVAAAREQADAALLIAPKDARVRLQNARVKFLEGDKAAGMVEIDLALEFDAGLANAIIFKARLLGDRGEVDAALAFIEGAIENVRPEDFESLRNFRLQLLRSTGYEDQIEAELRALASEFPEQVRYQYGLGRLLGAAGRVDEAEQVIRHLIARNPEDPTPKYELVNLLTVKRGENAAAAELKKMISLDPENLQFQLMLGVVYENFANPDAAYGAYAKLADLSPLSDEGVRARNRMVAIDLKRGDLDSARALTDEVLAGAPDNPDALMISAVFHFSDRNYDEAIAALRVIMRTNESSEGALRLLARVHASNGDSVLAQDAYRRLLALNPLVSHKLS